MAKHKGLIITVDGPAGAGKSTVSKELAKRLNYAYLDTGAIYRAVAYQVIKKGISTDDESVINDLMRHLNIKLECIENRMLVSIGGIDVTDYIRTEEIGLAASKISALPVVRKALLGIQRDMGRQGSIVAEGRDMGTVVFPHADLKFFLDAESKERIKRRQKELLEKGINIDINSIEKDMTFRDKQDCERAVAPLKIPKEAIVIDSSNMSVFDVTEKMVDFINKYNNLK